MGYREKVAQTKSLVTRVSAWVRTLRITRVLLRFTANGGNLLAAGMSFKAIFAIFAALWVGFATFGLFLQQNKDLQTGVITWINQRIPGLIGPNGAVDLGSLLEAQILGWTGAIAAVSLLFVAVGWLATAREAIRRMFGVPWKPDNNILMKVRDFALAAILAIAILVSVGLTVVSSTLLRDTLMYVGVESDSWFVGGATRAVALAIMFIFDTLVLAATYRILSGVAVNGKILFRVALVVAAVLSGMKLLGSQLLAGANGNPLLASFATFIGLLIWFNLICRVILLGAAWIAIESEDRFGSVPANEGEDEHDERTLFA
ncbi:YihY/virulence factor BrkB family protein [Lysinibacter sp. HNR]|uniref:YihY/virulence factor BrkB family protein n=1 Tax=Lysinibacter sp. HNR TaxID=3031408 RepID=UPI0024358026|nr:YihY/virulence factor BrkB family protein [Lysinibacter sp. HNR]WGD37042.1 YihY/virulence factor BrkB family protein [Lysinibacter sp. HNR]